MRGFVFLLWGSIALSNTSGQEVFHHGRFTIITPQCIRLEYNDKDIFIDDPSLFAVNRKARFTDFKENRTNSQLTIDTGSLVLHYKPNGHEFSPENLQIEVRGTQSKTLWHPGDRNKQNLGGTLHNLDHVAGPQSLDPGLLSRDGWFLLDDTKRHLIKDNWVAARPIHSGPDWYFFGYGNDFRGALKSLTTISGDVPLPRKYVLGSWYSRWWPYTSQDYRNIVKEFHDHDFPLDMVVMDMDWHKTNSWTGYSWNRSLFPDAENYLQWLHSNSLHVTLNDHPEAGIGPYEDRYQDFMGALSQTEAANQHKSIPYNAGDQKYLKTLFSSVVHPLEDSGVDFWWVDWMGNDKFKFNTLDWVNEFYFHNSERTQLRGQQFSRWADWGDQRHPIHFSGDTHIGWPTLQFEVPFTSAAGNVGAFYWSHDIGGFEGLRNGELLARWTQFGAFSATLRLHSINKVYLDKRPWAYTKPIEESMRRAFHLRSELFPYTYSIAWQAHAESFPFIRPLYLHFPNVEEAYHHPDEYFYGEQFLVAPVTQPSRNLNRTVTQNVWLPPGIWYNWFTGQRFSGDQIISVTSGINTFPLFARGGAPILMQPYTERMGTANLSNLRIKIFPGPENKTEKFALYEDDGQTKEYLRGGHALTTVQTRRTGVFTTIEISPTNGQYKGQLSGRSYTIEMPLSSIKTISVDSVPIRATSKKSFEIQVRDIRKSTIITVETAFPFDARP